MPIIDINRQGIAKPTETEQTIIDFINEHEGELENLSITSIAQKTFSSPATVTRTIQKCGFRGMADLRYKAMNQSQISDIYLVNAILAKSYRECTRTIDNLGVNDLLRIVDLINQADHVISVARGFTALIVEEFDMHLRLLGYDSYLIHDRGMMANASRLVRTNDAVIIATIKNTAPELTFFAETAAAKGAKVVTLSCVRDEALESASDIFVLGYSENVMQNERMQLIVPSRLSLMIICRTIIEYLNDSNAPICLPRK